VTQFHTSTAIKRWFCREVGHVSSSPVTPQLKALPADLSITPAHTTTASYVFTLTYVFTRVFSASVIMVNLLNYYKNLNSKNMKNVHPKKFVKFCEPATYLLTAIETVSKIIDFS